MNVIKSINNITQNQKVKVYRNIRKNVFSILDKQTQRIICHSETIVLTDVQFKVSQKGRERVRLEKQKRVHAYVIGNFLTTKIKTNKRDLRLVYYNPYFTDNFVTVDDNCAIFSVDKCYLFDGKVYIEKTK